MNVVLYASKIVWLTLLALVVAIGLFMTPKAHAFSQAVSHVEGRMDFGNNLLSKIYFTLQAHEQLELSEEQIAEINGLKFRVKTELMRGNAEMNVAVYELFIALNNQARDRDRIQALVQQKQETMAAFDDLIVGAYIELEEALEPEQSEWINRMWYSRS